MKNESGSTVPAWFRYFVGTLAAVFLVPLVGAALVVVALGLIPVALVGLPFIVAALVRFPGLERPSFAVARQVPRAPARLVIAA